MKKIIILLVGLACINTFLCAKNVNFFYLQTDIPDEYVHCELNDYRHTFINSNEGCYIATFIYLRDSVVGYLNEIDRIYSQIKSSGYSYINMDSIERLVSVKKSPFYKLSRNDIETIYLTKRGDTIITNLQLFYVGSKNYAIVSLSENPAGSASHKKAWNTYINSLTDNYYFFSHGIRLFCLSWRSLVFWLIFLIVVMIYSISTHKPNAIWYDHFIFAIAMSIPTFGISLLIYGWDVRACAFFVLCIFCISLTIHWSGEKGAELLKKIVGG